MLLFIAIILAVLLIGLTVAYNHIEFKTTLFRYLLPALGVCLSTAIIVISAIWFSETFAKDDATLARWVGLLLGFALSFLLASFWMKKDWKLAKSLLLAAFFLTTVAFLICMVTLASFAIRNGVNVDSSSLSSSSF